ncbi:hypothetical protein [Clostridium sp.]|uniref:hypothetical protein n=1 Tax=Clostridium sp. TaxID=1506 RepID=UPI002FC63DE6
MPETLINSQIKSKGLKKNYLADKLHITDRTLRRWTQYENIEQIKCFIKLSKILDIDFNNLILDIEKHSK